MENRHARDFQKDPLQITHKDSPMRPQRHSNGAQSGGEAVKSREGFPGEILHEKFIRNFHNFIAEKC
jgi:hypothetical protein